jgi:RNA polymerase sigma-70 factor, ECF subfamily
MTQGSAPHPKDDAATVAFGGARRRLFGIAYRILGSAAEAEDVVQDVWIRWQGADRREIVDPTAFLVTTATRVAINVAQSARKRRETYIGPWLPEPLDTAHDPELGLAQAKELGLAVLVLLEKLTPAERAAYVLREAFDYSYESIAEILSLKEPTVRQHVTRARKHLAEERRAPVPASDQKRLLEAFVAAAQRGDRTALERLFAADVASVADGGGAAKLAARVPVVGRERVARFVASFADRFWEGAEVTWAEANGGPAVLVAREGTLVALATVDASAEGIERIYWVMNPEKLRAWEAARAIRR